MVAAGVRSALAGALLARSAQHLLLASPAGAAATWTRPNHRGRSVSLLSGPALVVTAAVTSGLPLPAAAAAALGSASVGAYDDAAGHRTPEAKGFRGHLGALRTGRVTTGAVKVVGLSTAGLAATRLLGPARTGDLLLGGAVVAGSANLLNLLDLRPGRALKAGGVAALALGQPGPAAACGALLPDDLAERTMLGDAGANALGALLGLALVQRRDRSGRVRALTCLLAATAVSEVVSYSRVIDAVAPLRWVDRLGRLP